ncbi:MAG TPA: DNA replication/repair protein RecF [Candidatus Edwardsbacteria bacterium]|nr:DNA replication/repair protein RecF [Candidatus Edwardsbacteria bacterium]
MRITSLSGSGFRNLDDFSLEFDRSKNIFIGPNGAGKTNMLEALYYLCIGRSMRINAEDVQLVRFDRGLLRLEGRAESSQGPLSVEVGYDKAEKRLKINGEVQQKLSELIGRMPVVSLSPEDDELCKAGPAVRRRFLDLAISQFSKAYLADLQDYRRVLQQRNRLLLDWRDGRSQGESLDAWNRQLCGSGLRIVKKRLAVIDGLKELAGGRYARIAGGAERLGLRYHYSCQVEPGEPYETAWQRALADNAQFERMRGTTMYGPHRDDLEITIAGLRARSFGSQGQQRSAAIALKLAEADLLAAELKEKPVVLLDEIFAELDGSRGANLVEQLDPGHQVFIASAHDNGVSESFAIRKFRVESGRVTAA